MNIAVYKLKQIDKYNKKYWQIVEGKDNKVDGGFAHKEKWKAERRLKAITDFEEAKNGRKK